MRISQIIEKLKQEQKRLFSFEFFPPKNEEGFNYLIQTAAKLKELKPAFVSITYGAGGSTRQKTRDLTVKIQKEVGIESMAHLTCVGSNKSEIREILEGYRDEGIENILALRGDPPKGETSFKSVADGFSYANELVSFIREDFDDFFDIGVAGYPEKHKEALSFDSDLENLQGKIAAGSHFIITQLFLDNKYFFNFLKKIRSMGIHLPVLAGIMPVTDLSQIKRFTEMIGAEIPVALLSILEKADGSHDPEAVKNAGIDWAVMQCRELLANGVDGIHFYTLNRSLPTLKIFEQLNP